MGAQFRSGRLAALGAQIPSRSELAEGTSRRRQRSRSGDRPANWEHISSTRMLVSHSFDSGLYISSSLSYSSLWLSHCHLSDSFRLRDSQCNHSAPGQSLQAHPASSRPPIVKLVTVLARPVNAPSLITDRSCSLLPRWLLLQWIPTASRSSSPRLARAPLSTTRRIIRGTS